MTRFHFKSVIQQLPLLGLSAFVRRNEKHSRTLAALVFAMVTLTPDLSPSFAQNANNAQGRNNASDRGQTQGTTNGVANGLDDGSVIPVIPPEFLNPGNGNANGNANGRGNGNGNQSCTIMITENGTFGSGFENNQLSSKIYGGRAGGAQIATSNGSFTLSIDPPLGFRIAPANGNQNVNMFATLSGNGATNFSETPGSIDIRLRNGLTNVQAHLTAERTDSNPFPVGFYQAELTLRCE